MVPTGARHPHLPASPASGKVFFCLCHLMFPCLIISRTQKLCTLLMNEEKWRRAGWEKNMKMIDLHNQEYNQGKQSFIMAMNAFGDMTNEEFRQVMNGLQNQKEKVFWEPLFAEIPPSIDWREEGYVIPVKDQGHCGSCWAFSATGALEGQMFRKIGKLISLSEQNLVDCSQSQGNEGCNRGLMGNAFQVESYKYKPREFVASDTGFMDIHQQERSLMKAVATMGPISVAVDASRYSFQFCEEGIYYDPECSSKALDHGVLVAGYGIEGAESDNNKYWIVKNSWGRAWGENSYIKMAKDWNNYCGIATSASYPIVRNDGNKERFY